MELGKLPVKPDGDISVDIEMAHSKSYLRCKPGEILTTC